VTSSVVQDPYPDPEIPEKVKATEIQRPEGHDDVLFEQLVMGKGPQARQALKGIKPEPVEPEPLNDDEEDIFSNKELMARAPKPQIEPDPSCRLGRPRSFKREHHESGSGLASFLSY
jgi:hypothetical protein